jgi:hypothetical protein
MIKMSFVTTAYLINLIFLEISQSIQIHRESKNRFTLYEPYKFATERELEDFIRSTPYYSNELKDFLLKPDYPGLLITNSWLQQFTINTELWVTSDEWLYYDMDYIWNPSLNKAPDRIELGMPVAY